MPDTPEIFPSTKPKRQPRAGGFVFDPTDGSLYIDLHERFRTVLHLTSWRDGFELFRAVDARADAWEPVEIDLAIPLLLWADGPARTADTLAARKFAEGIPEDIRDLARPFGWRQFPLLRLLRSEPEVRSIVEDNPVLAWLLADWLVEKEFAPSAAHELILGPRTEMLRQCAGVDTRAAINLLSRIRFQRYEATFLGDIRRLLALPELQKKLAALPRIPGTVLPGLLRCPAAVRFPLWRALAEACDGGTAAAYWLFESAMAMTRDIELMARHLGVADPQASYRACTTMPALRRLHDRWAARINERHDADAVARAVRLFGTSEFPEPPVPGSEAIRPIRNQRDLNEEGAVMHHCVAIYGDAVMRKRSYIYAVHAPQRATLELSVEGKQVLQLACACNAPVSEETRRAVQFWLREQSALTTKP